MTGRRVIEPTSLRLRADTASVRTARQFVRDLLSGSDRASDCELLVCELATNAVLHATTDYMIEVCVQGDTIRVDVFDGSTQAPVLKTYGANAITGRGLHIVDSLADRWGVEQSNSGKSVWFEIDMDGGKGG